MPDGAHLAELVAFVAVVETGSFTRAARRLERDATVVSRRVSALEERLGVRVLERSTRRVAPTEAGAALFTRARATLAELADAEADAVALASKEPRGRLRLALPASFGRMWLAPLLPEFLAAHPGVSIEASYANRFVDLLDEGFDAAVRIGALVDSGLVVRKLADRARLLCAAPSYVARHGAPRAPRDLERHACLVFSGLASHPYWHLVKGGRPRVTVRPEGPYVSDDAEALLSACVAGTGIMLAADWLVARLVASGALVHVLPEWTTEEKGAVHLVTPSRRLVPAKTKAFARWLSRRFTPVPPWEAPVRAAR